MSNDNPRSHAMKKNGCYITQTDHNQESCLVLEAPWNDSFKTLISDNQIKYLRLSQSAGWQDNNIDFLAGIPSLNGVEIFSSRIKDITPITQLFDLKQLALECPYKAINFSTLTNLEYLFLRWRPKSETIFDLPKMTVLNIVNFPDTNLSRLSDLRNLTTIKLTSRKLQTLHGIENMQELITADLFQCTNLESLENIDQCKKLTNLEIEGCKKICNIDLVRNNERLKRISINNCGEVYSLKPLADLNDLEEIIFVDNTKVTDGNLSFFCDLPKLKNTRFADRKHYSLTREYINSQLKH